jgi:heat-inducible transcriptional repressor
MNEVLNLRLAELLNQSIEEYIKSAVPISSNAIAGKGTHNLSSATIRNDLKMLEQLGYMRQIHTSGGRVPTRLGYDEYVASTINKTFASDLIGDLQELSRVVERIDRKLNGSRYPIRTLAYGHEQERRNNIYMLLENPELEMSAFYLIIKEMLDGRK